jgi:hypothetical protein
MKFQSESYDESRHYLFLLHVDCPTHWSRPSLECADGLWITIVDTNGVSVARHGLLVSQHEAHSIEDNFPTHLVPIRYHVILLDYNITSKHPNKDVTSTSHAFVYILCIPLRVSVDRGSPSEAAALFAHCATATKACWVPGHY